MFALLLVASGGAQEVGAILRPEVVVDLASDRPHEDTVEAYTRIRAFASGEPNSRERWFIEVMGQQDLLFGDDIEGAWELRVGETGWLTRSDTVDLRIGNLVERWGKLDLLPQLDVLNPRDLRYGLLPPTEWQRIPIPMVALGVGTAPVRGELIYIPFAAADRMSMNGTDWSMMRQGMLEGELRQVADRTGTQFSEDVFGGLFDQFANALEDLDPSFRRGINEAVSVQQLPQSLYINGELAARLELDVQGFDGAIAVANLRNRQRKATINEGFIALLQSDDLPGIDDVQNLQTTTLVSAEWPRQWVVGAEANTVIDAFSVRAESVYLSNDVVARPWLRSATTPVLGTGLGIDYSYGTTFHTSVEVSYRKMLAPPKQTHLEHPDAVMVAGGVRGRLLASRLQIQLGGGYHVQFEEYFARPLVSYRVSDPIELEAGAILLGGPKRAPSTLSQAVTYPGGFAGYFSQNDAVTLAMNWIL